MSREILERDRAATTTPYSQFDEITRRALVTYSQRETRRGFLKAMERFFLGAMGVAVIPGRAHAEGKASAGRSAAGVALKAQFVGGKPYTLGVPKVTHGHGAMGVLWVPGRYQQMGVRMTAQPDTGLERVHVEFVGLADFSTSPSSWEEFSALSGVPLGSYDLSQGSPIHISSPSGFPMPDLSVLLTPVEAGGCGPTGCGCTGGGPCCYPKPNQCMECGDCGTCCAPKN